MTKEYRSAGLMKAKDEGLVDAYLTKWGTVDAYNSTFRRGAFQKTFETRGPSKIRLLWNHEKLAGKVLACREDDTGPFVRVKFNLETDAGREAFAHVRSGDVDCFSFGFRALDDGYVKGVREIREVELMEVGPVVFEANPAAQITDVRATDFDATVAANDLIHGRMRAVSALEQTLEEIFWNDEGDMAARSNAAIDAFKKAYLAWAKMWEKAGGRRSAPRRLDTFAAEIAAAEMTPKDKRRIADLMGLAVADDPVIAGLEKMRSLLT